MYFLKYSKKLKSFLPSDLFARHVIILMTGTGIAQVLPILISPILTRLFTPEDFGVLAIYTALCSILSVVVTGRYDLAIVLPKEDSEAANIVALSVFLNCGVSGIIFFIILLFNKNIAELLGTMEISFYLYLLPISIFMIGIYSSLNYWFNRKKEYKKLATNRILRSSNVAGVQLLAGNCFSGPSGLVFGQMWGQILASIFLGFVFLRENFNLRSSITKSNVMSMARKFVSFPKYMILGHLANLTSGYVPLLLLSAFFGPAVAGLYALAQRTISLPMMLVGNAIGDVFRQEAAELYNQNGNCKDIYLKTVVKLFFFAILPVFPLLFFGPSMFSIVFGEEWRGAGEIASIISIMVFFQTISSPLSPTVLLAGMQGIDLIWQSFRFLLSLTSFYIGYFLFDSYKIAIIIYAVSFSFLYILHSFLQYKAALGSLKTSSAK